MDVTKEVNQIAQTYGGTPSSIAATTSTSKVLNFAEGASINNPVNAGTITRLPFTINFKGRVGSFGADNQFFEIKTDIKDLFQEIVLVNGYQEAITVEDYSNDMYYVHATLTDNDNATVNTYRPGYL